MAQNPLNPKNMEYKNRTYREHFRKGRWTSFILKHKKTDVWIGIDKESYQPDMPEFCSTLLQELHCSMENYLRKDPNYLTALVPYDAKDNAPEIFRQMSSIARKTNIGPMSAVAGAVAHYIVTSLKKQYQFREAIIENGGDIYADIQEDIDISVFAGTSPLSEKVGLHINAQQAPLGICTSSGTVGPSLSFGKADAVMIICQDVLLADSFATKFANFVQKPEDINPVLEKISKFSEILSAMIIKDDKMGVIGKFEMKLFN